jgi:hypothetical protein
MRSLLEHTDTIRQKGRRWRKIRNFTFLVLVSGFIGWGCIQYYYPRSSGIVSGKINRIVCQGHIFRTYEGKLILSDNQFVPNPGIQLKEFDFSIASKSIADKLTYTGDKIVELHYTEYFKAIPWRGSSRYVVDDILTISEEIIDNTGIIKIH